ncbi:hypothetical protein GL982_10800 (plasmid) [Spiroplasma citri]|uniref:Uncharacterized protein n=1 Tax=Spiroplasma citri TaxID=2133 RepID=A0AAJ4ELB9_SPICI|nr:hypothetical protein [Spiroplasma citri]QED25592.1 hypothetical protein FRX96_09955 [Spiroplasma citri]QIA69934.1 hypothetical protein GL298_10920 [Spiroplasma citri]QIA71956.1 hypothetical protein GL981_11710 [Spiroplasma citri]QIA74032.1 hypothetical protein GL982_10800 [Spiroplasma citri]
MKKLLSILTISTLTASIPAPLLAAVPLTNTLTSNSKNDYLPLKEFKNISGDIYRMTIDSKDNIYFSLFANGAFGVFVHDKTVCKIFIFHCLIMVPLCWNTGKQPQLKLME